MSRFSDIKTNILPLKNNYIQWSIQGQVSIPRFTSTCHSEHFRRWRKARTYVREEQTSNQRVILSEANNPVNCLRSRTRRKEGNIEDVGISYGLPKSLVVFYICYLLQARVQKVQGAVVLPPLYGRYPLFLHNSRKDLKNSLTFLPACVILNYVCKIVIAINFYRIKKGNRANAGKV